MTEFTCIGFLFFMNCQMPAPVVIDNYSTECRVHSISKRDTPETQRILSNENARCRTAKAKKK